MLEAFKDRSEAADLLIAKLQHLKSTNSVILAIPRGGVPIGYQVSGQLKLPFELLLVKKISHPYKDDQTIGALNLEDLIFDENKAVYQEYIEVEAERIRKILKEKYKDYLSIPQPDLTDKTVIIVDDGMATGFTMSAAIDLLKVQKPKSIIVAVPVAAAEALNRIDGKVDEIIYLKKTSVVISIGQFYQNYDHVSDEDVSEILDKVSQDWLKSR